MVVQVWELLGTDAAVVLLSPLQHKVAFLCLLSLVQDNDAFSQDPQKHLGPLQLTDFLGSSSTEGGAVRAVLGSCSWVRGGC